MMLGADTESRKRGRAHQPVILKCLSRIREVCFIFRLLVDSPKQKFINEGVTEGLNDRQVVDRGGENQLSRKAWDLQEDHEELYRPGLSRNRQEQDYRYNWTTINFEIILNKE